MRITKGQLARIIKEEVARALLEAEVINADSGEVLTLPRASRVNTSMARS